MAKMNVAPRDRPKVKFACLRMLTSLKLSPAKTHLIGVCIENYLKLNAEEMKRFEREVDQLSPAEKEETMETMTYWERKGLEQGIEKGLEQGLEQGRSQGQHEGKEELMTLLLEQRFSTLPASITGRLDRLSSEQFNELGKALGYISSLADLEDWLSKASQA
jgi:flagellar biosynthesis/type III secretory pathway protein FliH